MTQSPSITRAIHTLFASSFTSLLRVGYTLASDQARDAAGSNAPPVLTQETSRNLPLAWINIVGAVLVIGLIYLVFRLRRSKPPTEESTDVPPQDSPQS